LLCLAGSSWSFDQAATYLRELCGLRTCHQTIRAVCQQEAGALADWLHADPAAGAAFRRAEGDSEFYTDGTMVNTWEGWREMRLGLFAKRQRGRPSRADAWASRRWPTPQARLAFAAVETAQRFGPRWRRWAGRLGIRDPTQITVVADGAEWIWNQAAVQLPGATGLLDIFHALEHLHGGARAVFGEGTPQAAAWVEQARQALLTGGGAALAEHLTATKRQVRAAGKRRAVAELEQYFGRQHEHLGYAARLAGGQAIGSGLVEGACKQLIGRRLKQTGARWRVRRANRMATLCCALHSDTWEVYWHHRLH
jgi:hypothetical protein